MPGPISNTQIAVVNAGFGVLMAARGYSLPAAAAVVLLSEVTGVVVAKYHPELVSPAEGDYGPTQFVINVGTGLVAWLATAALMKYPPNLYDGVPLPSQTRRR